MAQARYQLITATGTYIHVPDWQQCPFDLSYAIEVPPGVTAGFTVAYTLSNPDDLTWTAIWLPDPTNGTTKTASVHGGYAAGFLIRALALTVASITGTTGIRWSILQGSSAR
jgi:hypothetical protein